jgi:tetratricopeptide (TPR) repeat protein
MKNYLVLALALTLGFSLHAQKKELRSARKALLKENYENAGVALDAAETLLPTMNDKYKSKYYLYRSMYYSKSGGGTKVNTVKGEFNDIKKSIEALKLVTAKADADLLKFQKQRLLSHLINTGNSLVEKNDFENSSIILEEAYNLSPSDTLNLFIAANYSARAKNYDRSLVLFEKLRELEYTGIEKKFFAVNVETQKKESFNSEIEMIVSIKAKTHINPTEELTKSRFPLIIKNIGFIYTQRGENDKALEAFAVARADDPESVDLLLREAEVYYKIGNIAKFKELLELAVQKDPTNPDLQFNLGIISSDAKDFETSKKYFLRAIELKPDYTQAYLQVALLILDQEKSYNDQMNSLGSSRSDNIKYDKLIEERNKMVYLAAIPYLEGAISTDPDNYQAVKTLSNIYSVVGDTKKYKKYKAMADSLNKE